jgi:hypothetical protein
VRASREGRNHSASMPPHREGIIEKHWGGMSMHRKTQRAPAAPAGRTLCRTKIQVTMRVNSLTLAVWRHPAVLVSGHACSTRDHASAAGETWRRSRLFAAASSARRSAIPWHWPARRRRYRDRACRPMNSPPRRAPPAASANCSPCPRTSAWRSTGTRSTANSKP